MTKKEVLFKHAKLRLATRYGDDLTNEMHELIIKKLKGTPDKGVKISCRKFLRHISINKKQYYLIWDRKRECVITFLTQEMYKNSIEKKKK